LRSLFRTFLEIASADFVSLAMTRRRKSIKNKIATIGIKVGGATLRYLNPIRRGVYGITENAKKPERL